MLTPALLAACLPAVAGAADTGSFGELIDLDRPVVPHDNRADQASSFDRSGGNEDRAIEKDMALRRRATARLKRDYKKVLDARLGG